MAALNLLIEPIIGYTALERAKAISEELFCISRPKTERKAEDVTKYLFAWIEHPTTGEVVLRGDDLAQIFVHNKHDLTDLIALMPNTPFAEKQALKDFIKSKAPYVTFGQIIPSNSTLLTDAQMQAAGWFDEQVTP